MDVGHEALTARIAECAPGDIAISVISYAEVAYGTCAGKPPPTEVLESFVAAIPLLPFDEAAARAYAQMPFKTESFDRLLAGHSPRIWVTIIPHHQTHFN